jgi:hypothetical protein
MLWRRYGLRSGCVVPACALIWLAASCCPHRCREADHGAGGGPLACGLRAAHSAVRRFRARLCRCARGGRGRLWSARPRLRPGRRRMAGTHLARRSPDGSNGDACNMAAIASRCCWVMSGLLPQVIAPGRAHCQPAGGLGDRSALAWRQSGTATPSRREQNAGQTRPATRQLPAVPTATGACATPCPPLKPLIREHLRFGADRCGRRDIRAGANLGNRSAMPGGALSSDPSVVLGTAVHPVPIRPQPARAAAECAGIR